MEFLLSLQNRVVLDMAVAFRKYPIGVYNFDRIISENYLYVDKTHLVYDIAKRYPYVFLSRPRRFGKSLLVDTLKCYFEARKELFEGLNLASMETEWIKYPVLRFDMSKAKYHDVHKVESSVSVQIEAYESIYGKNDTEKSLGDRLSGLIKRAHAATGHNVVLLIDEYDSPMLEVFHEKDTFTEVRRLLMNFYGPIKSADEHLRFGFMTGITKFSQMGIFSGINNLKDISMLDAYSDICGISKEELLTRCISDIEDMAEHSECAYEDMVQRLTDNYDGYHFSKNAKDVFNPFSLINAFNDKELRQYWFESGTPTFLFETVKHFNTRIAELDGQKVRESDFSISPEYADTAVPILYQAGYLTIKGFDPDFKKFTLGFPNNEVRFGFLNSFLPVITGTTSTTNSDILERVTIAFREGDVEAAMTCIKSFIASMPYHYDNTKEADFQTIMYVILALVGMYVKVEVSSSMGRADAIVETSDYVYIIEYKLDQSADAALQQIEEKHYADPYLSDSRKVIKVGVNFSSELRGLESWKTV